ncbi:MAG: hypothetical protein ACK4I8_02880 [Armatimonadota bacterium]
MRIASITFCRRQFSIAQILLQGIANGNDHWLKCCSRLSQVGISLPYFYGGVYAQNSRE